jgi:YqjK-like protein
MTNMRIQLAERRAALVSKAAQQRMQLTASFEALRAPLALADQGLNVVRNIAKHPFIVTGVVALAVVAKPKRWIFILESGWMAWRLALAAKRKLSG